MSDKTVNELRKEAAEKNIKGRSKMNRAELCKALGYKNCGKRATKKEDVKKKVVKNMDIKKKVVEKRVEIKEKDNLKNDYIEFRLLGKKRIIYKKDVMDIAREIQNNALMGYKKDAAIKAGEKYWSTIENDIILLQNNEKWKISFTS